MLEVGGSFFILFLPVAKPRAAGAWRFSRMWRELLTNTCFPAPSPGMPRGPRGGCHGWGGGAAGTPPSPGASLPAGSCGRIWASLLRSEVGLPKPVPVPGRGHQAPPSPPGCSDACPARAGAQEGTPQCRGGAGGSAGAHAHAACDPRPFFINEKNVQGLNDRQEQIYSSSPEIKLK